MSEEKDGWGKMEEAERREYGRKRIESGRQGQWASAHPNLKSWLRSW